MGDETRTPPDRMTEDELARVVDGLLESYDRHGRDAATIRWRVPRLPSREAIVGVLEQCRRLLFPGYYADDRMPEASRRYLVGTWVCQLHTDLSRVVRLALAHEDPDRDPVEVRTRAVSTASGLIAALPELREKLLLDAEAALDGDPAARNLEEIILTYPGFEAITTYRIAHWLYQSDIPYIPRAMTEHAHMRTGIDIHPGARIGARFFIDHGTGVVIGETTDIGDDVKVYQGVTLGALSVRRELAGAKRHPTIEDGVVLYAGATVLGGRTVIGRGAVIGGNVWLTESVAPGTTVIESPPRLDFRGPERATPSPTEPE